MAISKSGQARRRQQIKQRNKRRQKSKRLAAKSQ